MEDEPVDLVVPTQIEHLVDEVWIDGRLEQRYNYLDYHFEAPGAYLRARFYLDKHDVVTVFGPFDRRSSVEPVVSTEFAAACLAYLARRFAIVNRFT